MAHESTGLRFPDIRLAPRRPGGAGGHPKRTVSDLDGEAGDGAESAPADAAVFDWAKASGFRTGDNPVEGVTKVLPKRNMSKRHFAALPYAEVPEFLITLRDCRAGVSAKLAFEFMILTAAHERGGARDLAGDRPGDEDMDDPAGTDEDS
jgi:hypothetical protein